MQNSTYISNDVIAHYVFHGIFLKPYAIRTVFQHFLIIFFIFQQLNFQISQDWPTEWAWFADVGDEGTPFKDGSHNVAPSIWDSIYNDYHVLYNDNYTESKGHNVFTQAYIGYMIVFFFICVQVCFVLSIYVEHCWKSRALCQSLRWRLTRFPNSTAEWRKNVLFMISILTGDLNDLESWILNPAIIINTKIPSYLKLLFQFLISL